MLNMQFLKLETPIAWMRSLMPQENKKKSVEMIDNGFGDGTGVYRVGQKMMYITFGEDGARDDLFVTNIVNAYVKTLKTRQGYFVPDTFEMDEKTGTYKEISREDEKLLIETLAKDDLSGIDYRKHQDKKPITYHVLGKYFSAENGIVRELPLHPDKPPKHRKDIRLEH